MNNIPQHISESLFANQIKGESRNRTSFALFPVRIETRFMDMTLPQTKERNRVVDAFRQMNVVICHALRLGSSTVSPNERKQFARELAKLADTLGYLDGIYREDKMLLDELTPRIRICVDHFVAHLPRNEQDAARASLNPIMDNVIAYSKSIPTVNARKADKATLFLDEYEKMYNRIRAVSMLKTTPYSGYHKENPKVGNLNLIRHLDTHLGECLQFVRSMPEKLALLPSMNKEQRARFTRYTKLLLTGKEFEKLDTSMWPRRNILLSEGSLRYAYENVGLVQFRFSKEVWEGKMSGLIPQYRNIISSIWYQLGSSYDQCREVISGKPFTSVRYTHLIKAALSMKLDYVEALGEGIVCKTDLSALRRMASMATYDYQKGKSFTASLLKEMNELPHGGSPIDVAPLEKYAADTERLESARKEKGKKTYCLCVRIFPDEIGVNRFVEELTRQEEYDGMAFWLRHLMAQNAGDKDLMKAAWSMLCDRYAPYRAGWIARCLRPGNGIRSRFSDMFGKDAAAKVAGEGMDFINSMVSRYLPDPADARASEAAVFFPKVKYRNPNDFGKPVSPVLPDRFVFEGKIKVAGQKPYTIVKYGRRVFPDLQVALDFNENLDLDPFVVDQSTGALTVNSGIRWMTSYGMAEKMGMAITIPLGDIKDFSFESVYVMGVKNGTTAEAANLIDRVLKSHFYSEEGLDLLKIGTATNILDDKAADASYDTSREAISEMHYQHDVLELSPSVAAGSDAARLASILGSSKSKLDQSVLGRVAHSGNKDIQDSVSANSKLADYFFPKYTRNPQKKSSRTSDIREQHILQGFAGRVHNFISNDISSRGLFPPMRIGAQPYGIVPVTDFANFMAGDDNLLQLSKLLLYLTGQWNRMAEENVIHEANMAGKGNDDMVKNYIEMIGCTPTSSSFYARDYIENPDVFDSVFFRNGRLPRTTVAETEDFVLDLFKLHRKSGDDIGATMSSLLEKFNKLPVEKVVDPEKNKDPYLGEISGNPWGDIPGRLAHISASEEERRQLVAEFFDLFSYRLDAWTMGLLNYTLRKRIEKGIHSLRIGAFGWVFNLSPDKKEKKSEEYILAPSITHAITGAVLRSSYVKSTEKGGDVRLNVNLSSVRVREALRIIRGLQNGLSVGAILGSDLERYLHDSWKTMGKEMDAFIYPLRQMYPLVVDVTKADDSADSRIRSTIINGESLIADLRGNVFANESDQIVDLYHKALKQGNEKLKKFLEDIGNEDNDKLEVLFLQIQRMEDSYDALRDVVMSESVYKLAEGNRVAVDALMNCMQQGRNIPMPDAVEVPMHSAHIEQRVIAALDTEASSSADDNSALRIADPAVDAWMDTMLSGHSRIDAGFLDGSRVETRPLSDCGISASELVYLSGNGDSFYKYLEWSYARACGYGYVPKLAPGLSGGGENLSLSEAELAIDSLRDMLTDARILKADDLLMENVNPDSAYDLADLKERFGKVYARVTSTWKAMAEFIESNSLGNAGETAALLGRDELSPAVGCLLDCYSFGIATALDGLDSAIFPPESMSSDPHAYIESLKAQESFRKSFLSVYGILSDRLSHIDLAGLEAAASASKYIEAAQNLLVKSFKMVPRLNFPEPEFTRFSMDEDYVYDWIEDAAKVRRPVFDLHTIRMFSRLHDYSEPSYGVMQLPGDAARWIGDGSGDIDESMIDDAKSYVVIDNGFMYGKDKSSVAGLVLDSWVERIPYKTQTAALAFSYDQPDAEAPHAILMAVAPNIASKKNEYYGTYISDNWSPTDFVRSIKSSMHLVKSRAVEPDHIYNDRFASAFFPILNVEYKDR